MEVCVHAPRLRCNAQFPVGSVVKDVLTRFVQQQFGSPEDFYVIRNGRVSDVEDPLQHGAIYHLQPRLCGGKGGFGSMLRALGAQIEKTTNREACRDLSGRRLRDVNHEKEMAEWLKKQAEREAEKEQRRLDRLQRKLSEPKHQFTDPEYQQQCHDLSERLEDSVLLGLQASSSGHVKVEDVSATKRSNSDQSEQPQKKKKKKKMASACFWTGVGELDELLSSEDEDDDDEASSSSSCGAVTTTMQREGVEPEQSSSSSSTSSSARQTIRASKNQEPPETRTSQTRAQENQEPPETRASKNQEPPETRAQENQEPPQTRAQENQEPPETRASKNQEPPETRAQENQEPSETRASENQEPSETRASENQEPSATAAVSGSVIGVVRRSAGVSGSGRPEGGTNVSGVKVWGGTVGACRPTLLRQGADSRSDRPGITHQTRKEEEEVKSSEVEQTLVSTLSEKFSF
ncbi:replication stress response regulator SDE2 isoform X2 [Hippoglossus hippoglossus]|uniref:replication stress response regulator SDE2 isoform X2 n=1 Tax=Hippoglossus hippoglossus TaxID=8267 RepID=UPI00148CCBD0|nr:replication stress response regulator SDE2 isoform X2 [Hippoglossus hippoglossus]